MSNKVLKRPDAVIRHAFVEQGLQAEHPVEFGAVYFRRSNPPRQDWERDYAVAREDGHTLFRHWFNWADIHVAPDTFNFEPYDEHLRLAAKYGIKTIIAEMITNAPDWLYHSCPEGRFEDSTGFNLYSEMNGSACTGSTRMCLDHPVVRREAEKFLRALAEHYRDMPGMYGYDIWNENSFYLPSMMCYAPATQAKFREWLKKKYGTLENLRQAWRRYSLTDWEDIEMPRRVKPFPDSIDAVQFHNDNAIEQMKFREAVLRKYDPNHYIVAHCNGKTHCDIPACDDAWRAAEQTDIYGYTFWYANKCNTFLGSDSTRMAANGRLWWRAEALGDHDWGDADGRSDEKPPQYEHDAMHDPLNIRRDAVISLAAGTRGFINPRWRALQDGFLHGAFGWYNLDGSRSDRSEMVRQLAEWANGELSRPLWHANPVRGDIGLLLLEEPQIYVYTYYGSTKYYNYAYQGAYDALTDSGLQADPIRFKDLEDYRVIYVPCPIALSQATIDRIQGWVEAGGTLISEACFGHFNEHGHEYEHQPSRSLEKLLGCRQRTVHLGPDMWKGLRFDAATGSVGGGVFRQSYQAEGGVIAGIYADGDGAVVEHDFGKGRVRLIGTMPGYSYHIAPDEQTRRFFASHLAFADVEPYVSTPLNTGIVVRVWADESRVFAWIVNTTEGDQVARVEFDPSAFEFDGVRVLRGGAAKVRGNRVEIACPQRDAVVIELVRET